MLIKCGGCGCLADDAIMTVGTNCHRCGLLYEFEKATVVSQTERDSTNFSNHRDFGGIPKRRGGVFKNDLTVSPYSQEDINAQWIKCKTGDK